MLLLIFSTVQSIKCSNLRNWQFMTPQAQSGQGQADLPSLKLMVQSRNWGLLTALVTVKISSDQDNEHIW